MRKYQIFDGRSYIYLVDNIHQKCWEVSDQQDADDGPGQVDTYNHSLPYNPLAFVFEFEFDFLHTDSLDPVLANLQV